MHEYKVEVLRVVFGDTVDVDIDLGFSTWLKKQRMDYMVLIHQSLEPEI